MRLSLFLARLLAGIIVLGFACIILGFFLSLTLLFGDFYGLMFLLFALFILLSNAIGLTNTALELLSVFKSNPEATVIIRVSKTEAFLIALTFLALIVWWWFVR